MNYFFLSPRTRMLFLFRRIKNCKHKYSCLESVFRKFYEVAVFYGLIRIPLKWIASRAIGGSEQSRIDSKWLIAAEILGVILIGCLRAAGCMVRFMNEEII